MLLILAVLLLALILGGLGFVVHVLWWIALVVLVIWLVGFLFRAAEGAGHVEGGEDGVGLGQERRVFLSLGPGDHLVCDRGWDAEHRARGDLQAQRDRREGERVAPEHPAPVQATLRARIHRYAACARGSLFETPQ